VELAEDGVAQCRFHTDGAMLNPWGLVCGGALAGMLDTLVGAACVSVDPDAAPVTTSLTTLFLRPVWPGEDLEGRAEVVRRGRFQFFTEARLFRKGRPRHPVAQACAVSLLCRPGAKRRSAAEASEGSA
jgi:uncharacterized protein (TIGR00369 family)